MGLDEIVLFIHASDLHLGRFQYTNPIRTLDYFNAFKDLLIAGQNVDFILLAGDVFNSIDLLPYYFSKSIEILKDFHKKTNNSIPVIAIEGNHDIRSFSRGKKIEENLSWLHVLANLGLITLLRAPLEDPDRNNNPIQIKDVKIYGNTYCGERIDENLKYILRNIRSNGSFNILINHFGIEGQMKGVPGQLKYKLDPYMKARINYLGLGHFHKQFVLDNYIFNPGCLTPACLSDFSLPHGYFLVEVTKNRAYNVNLTRKKLLERKILWKSLIYPSKPKTKMKLFQDIAGRIHKKHIIPYQSQSLSTQDISTPVLCLTIRSPSGSMLSAAVKKELRAFLLKIFNVVEVHIFQKPINYKPIGNFFQFS